MDAQPQSSSGRQLPGDLIYELCDFLPDFEAAIVVGRVCKSWRSAVACRREARRAAHGPQRPPLLPLW